MSKSASNKVIIGCILLHKIIQYGHQLSDSKPMHYY